jgi:hypothetical protein
MIEKKYCKDFNSNVSFLDYKIEDNKIIYEDSGYSLYIIYEWQQELINKMLGQFKKVILETHYINIDYVKELTFESNIEIFEGRNCSTQCNYCLNRNKCEEYKNALESETKTAWENDDQLYNAYILSNGKADYLKSIADELRENINRRIEEENNSLKLDKLGLILSIKQTEKDSYSIEELIKDKLANDKTLSIRIGELKKLIKGKKEYEDKLTKVPFQKKLVVE